MRRRIEALSERLEEFASEDAHDALVLECLGEAASGIVGAAAELLGQRGSSDVFLASFGRFETCEALAGELLTQIRPHAAVLGLLDEGRGEGSAWARLASRLDAVVHALALQGDARVVVSLCPTSHACESAYAALALELVQRARRVGPRIRVVLRDTPGHEISRGLRRQGAHVLEAIVDASVLAIRDALAEDALDVRADPRVRAAAALTLAMADAAIGREQEALAALSTLADFHHASGDPTSRALCFVLAGSVLARQGEIAQARDCAGRALGLAVEVGSPMLALHAAMTAAELAHRAADARQADAHFDLAARIAARIGQPSVVAHALLRRAAVFASSGEIARARDALSCSAVAAHDAGAPALERDALDALAALYRDAGMGREADGVLRRRLAVSPASDPAHHAHCP